MSIVVANPRIAEAYIRGAEVSFTAPQFKYFRDIIGEALQHVLHLDKLKEAHAFLTSRNYDFGRYGEAVLERDFFPFASRDSVAVLEPETDTVADGLVTVKSFKSPDEGVQVHSLSTDGNHAVIVGDLTPNSPATAELGISYSYTTIIDTRQPVQNVKAVVSKSYGGLDDTTQKVDAALTEQLRSGLKGGSAG